MALWTPRQLELLARIYPRDMLASRMGGLRSFKRLLDDPKYQKAFERGARVLSTHRRGGKYLGPASLSGSTLSHDEHMELVRLCNPFAVQKRFSRMSRTKSALNHSNFATKD